MAVAVLVVVSSGDLKSLEGTAKRENSFVRVSQLFFSRRFFSPALLSSSCSPLVELKGTPKGSGKCNQGDPIGGKRGNRMNGVRWATCLSLLPVGSSPTLVEPRYRGSARWTPRGRLYVDRLRRPRYRCPATPKGVVRFVVGITRENLKGTTTAESAAGRSSCSSNVSGASHFSSCLRCA